MKSLIVTSIGLAIFSALSPAQRTRSPHPELVVTHARIVTMNRRQPVAEALAVAGGRIVWVGSNAEAGRRFSNAAESIDLKGATVLPGIIDAHGHLMSLGESALRLNLKDVMTPEEAAERVRRKAATVRAGEWILGWGWDEGKWAAHYPTHELLTAAAPNNPVVLAGLHSFASWVNKKTLDVCGITRDTRDPANGKILRDEASGEPTGVLTNQAQDLVTSRIPALTLDQIKNALELAARECIRNGLTSVHEAKVTPIMLQAFRELVAEKRMPLRLYLMLDGSNRSFVGEWLARGPEIDPSHRLTIRSVKVFADGALGSRGAALFAPYTDAPATRGVLTTSEEEMYELTLRSIRAGFQVATHAIGDAANHKVLDAYERAMKDADVKEATSRRDARLRIEHAQVLAPADIPRFARLHVIASMQPTHCTSDMKWAEKRVGPERIKGAYAWRSVLRTGAHVPISSDFPGETLNPFFGLYAAITRQDPDGNPPDGWYPEQRMTIDEALRGYTIEAAYSEFEESDKGSIEPGKLADFIVISADPTRIPARELLAIRVLSVFVDGRRSDQN